jgi:hypothetical protein
MVHPRNPLTKERAVPQADDGSSNADMRDKVAAGRQGPEGRGKLSSPDAGAEYVSPKAPYRRRNISFLLRNDWCLLHNEPRAHGSGSFSLLGPGHGDLS